MEQRVKKLLRGIPKDLRDLFTPDTDAECTILEKRAEKLKKIEGVRNSLMYTQRKYGLDIRPNDSVMHAHALINIKKKRAKLDAEKREKDE